MGTKFSFSDKETTPSRSGDTTCYIFSWIGQSFNHCENCGKPYWEHLYQTAYHPNAEFRVKEWRRWSRKWIWTPVTVITLEMAMSCRVKWEGFVWESEVG